MPNLTHELASAPPPNHLLQPPKYSSTPTTAPSQSPILTLPHPRLIPSTIYHAYSPAAPSRYASDAGTPCPPSPILTLPHTRCLPCLCSRRTLKIFLKCCHPISALTHCLPCLHSGRTL
ncbi:hypothetical protein O181_022435 [Austropuccinia psidii MF-1]|uniref:Uncharacterized protein n=1 Tax=Austropuccinia psidii MF-1 TaxID=1389203 RepID=A0A9Q3CGI3_9BASI|nr:hypothetical protein [Austropuccinia psidii MF-1]